MTFEADSHTQKGVFMQLMMANQNDFFAGLELATPSLFPLLGGRESITRPLRLPHLPNPFPATPVSERYANAHDAAHGLD